MLLIPLVLGILMAITGGVFLKMVAERGWVGHRLDSKGVAAQAQTVEIGHVKKRSPRGGRLPGTEFDGVRVSFRTADGQLVTAELFGEDSDDVEGPLGWHPPLPGSRFSPPLELLYLPDDPQTVMTKSSALGFGRGAVPIGSILAGILVVGVVLVLASVWGRRRIRRRAVRSRT